METQIRRVPVLLPARDYEALKALAEREERTPVQQAAYIVRRSLATKNAGHGPAGTSDVPGQAA
jgi:hypothetical protein